MLISAWSSDVCSSDLPAVLLRLGDDVQRQSGLTRTLRAVDLDDPPRRQTTDPEGDIQTQGAGRDGLDLLDGALVAEAHQGALAEALLDLGDRVIQALQFRVSERTRRRGDGGTASSLHSARPPMEACCFFGTAKSDRRGGGCAAAT